MDRQETEEIKRHFGVVADGLSSEIRLVAEGVEGLRSEVDEFRKEVRAEFKEVRVADPVLVRPLALSRYRGEP